MLIKPEMRFTGINRFSVSVSAVVMSLCLCVPAVFASPDECKKSLGDLLADEITNFLFSPDLKILAPDKASSFYRSPFMNLFPELNSLMAPVYGRHIHLSSNKEAFYLALKINAQIGSDGSYVSGRGRTQKAFFSNLAKLFESFDLPFARKNLSEDNEYIQIEPNAQWGLGRLATVLKESGEIELRISASNRGFNYFDRAVYLSLNELIFDQSESSLILGGLSGGSTVLEALSSLTYLLVGKQGASFLDVQLYKLLREEGENLPDELEEIQDIFLGVLYNSFLLNDLRQIWRPMYRDQKSDLLLEIKESLAEDKSRISDFWQRIANRTKDIKNFVNATFDDAEAVSVETFFYSEPSANFLPDEINLSFGEAYFEGGFVPSIKIVRPPSEIPKGEHGVSKIIISFELDANDDGLSMFIEDPVQIVKIMDLFKLARQVDFDSDAAYLNEESAQVLLLQNLKVFIENFVLEQLQKSGHQLNKWYMLLAEAEELTRSKSARGLRGKIEDLQLRIWNAQL